MLVRGAGIHVYTQTFNINSVLKRGCLEHHLCPQEYALLCGIVNADKFAFVISYSLNGCLSSVFPPQAFCSVCVSVCLAGIVGLRTIGFNGSTSAYSRINLTGQGVGLAWGKTTLPGIGGTTRHCSARE